MTFNPSDLRNKLKNLTESSSKRTFNTPFADGAKVWKPKPGENRIRIIWTPWMMNNLYYLYFKTPSNLLSPQTNFEMYSPNWDGESKSFTEKDPHISVSETILAQSNAIYKANNNVSSEESKAIYKKGKQMLPKESFAIPIVDRTNEEAGAFWWSFGKGVDTALMQVIEDKELFTEVDGVKYDLTNDKHGFDIIVTFIPSKQNASFYKEYKGKFTDKVGGETFIKVARTSSPLAETDAKIQEIRNNIPDFRSIFRVPTMDELKDAVEQYIKESNAAKLVENNAPATTQAPTATTSTPKVETFDAPKQASADVNPTLKSKLDSLFED